MARVTLRLPDALGEEVEDYVGYGSKSEFYRKAATKFLIDEGAIDSPDDVDSEECGARDVPDKADA